MVMQLEKVIPFGRSLAEYVGMFNLTTTDLEKRILGVGDGPASFNAEATALGYTVTSIDPIYQFSGQEILQRFDAVLDNIINQVRATPDDWVWSYHRSPDTLRESRVQAMHTFLTDYDQGKAVGRYVTAELPNLHMPKQRFDLALCSHLLFLYSAQLPYSLHLESIQAMLRVSQEVRVFPLLTLMLERSPHLAPLMQALQAQGYSPAIVQVPYELQKGGNEMLVIKNTTS